MASECKQSKEICNHKIVNNTFTIQINKYARYYGIPVSAFLHNYTYRVVDKFFRIFLYTLLPAVRMKQLEATS